MPKNLSFIWLILLLLNLNSFSQDYQIKGTIQEDISREPIGLANVFVRNSTLGTASGQDGSYTLAIPDSLLNDTLVISAVGYKQQEVPLRALYPETSFSVFLQDSMFLLDEVVAFCYDYVEGLYWKSNGIQSQEYLLTFVSKNIQNVSNFLLILKGRFGQGKKKSNSYVWRDIEIPGVEGKTRVLLKFFRCGYCPLEDNITVTIDIDNNKYKNILLDDEYKLLISRYFQEILDQTFEQGVNVSQLEEKNKVYFLPSSETPYEGKVYGYFDSGKKGLRGSVKLGQKDGQWEYWFENGQKRMVVSYAIGQKTGLWVSWYKNGNIRIKNNYTNDRLDGKNYWWYENGQLKKLAFYKNGAIHGKIEWEESGALKEKRGVFENATNEEIKNLLQLKTQDQKISDFIQRFIK
ncbi:MAG: carboxypeptidase-like regulatory domain-containing protein [Bacteroidales bacterium]|nr:carboxypeptidase-like regulatory domain-containing protein [Bacteroidales bacterium]